MVTAMVDMTQFDRERLSRVCGVIHGVAVSSGLSEVSTAVLLNAVHVIDEILYPLPDSAREAVDE